MQYRRVNSGFGYVLRLERGERLVETLEVFAEKENITGAFFYGLGAVKNTTIGRYSLEQKEYRFQEILEVVELANLSGNIALLEGKPVVHAHGVLGDENLRAIAGHIKEATVAITCEIFMHLQHGAVMKRELDEDTGLPLLSFE